MTVRNVMEKLVSERLNVLIADYDCCKCDKCRNDMLACALNIVEPKYVTTREGELFTRLAANDWQASVDLDVAITKAIETVSKKPHHND